MTREEAIARQLIEQVGGQENIALLECCMTRVRIETHQPERIDSDALKQLEGVKGVVLTGTQLQVIFGPGLAQQVAEATEAMIPMPTEVPDFVMGKPDSGLAGTHAALAGTNTAHAGTNAAPAGTITSGELANRIAAVFVPLLPAIIGASMISALMSVLQRTNLIDGTTAIAGYSVINVLSVIGPTIMGFLSILVGQNAARAWGGPPAIGAVAGAILISPTLSSLHMTTGRGGLIGALIAGAFLGWLYNQIRRRISGSISFLITPLLTMLIGGLVVLFVAEPVGYQASVWISRFTYWLLGVGGPVAGFLLGSLFLPLVMLGVHQGLTPIHLELIKQTGETPLLPILAMGGAGQVGAAFAVYLKTTQPGLKRIIMAALPVGILGIGEPLIYGVTLPLVRPFFGACIGAGFGGAFIALIRTGAFAIGISGVVLTALVSKPVAYLVGVLIAYGCGFVATWLLGFDETRLHDSKLFTMGD